MARRRSKNPNPKNNGSDNGPLRRVVDWDGNEARDVLECGHKIIQATDMMGTRHPARRRCWKCKAGKPRDVKPENMPS